MLVCAAGNAEKKDKEFCLKLYKFAAEVWQNLSNYKEDEAIFSDLCFTGAIAFCLLPNVNEPEQSLWFMRKQNEILMPQLDKFEREVHRNFLMITLIQCSLDQYDQAERDYEKACRCEGYQPSGLGQACLGVLVAVASADPERYARALANQSIVLLPTIVSRYVNKMRLHQSVIRRGPKAPPGGVLDLDELDGDSHSTHSEDGGKKDDAEPDYT